ncbi:radical SAM protein [Dethiothermospora halolimnae]|uniref:radical SAM protein n=1 Tax=Dethiothermospora halolimnae TaxID=3114390 RepID=UPI003CCBD17A
MKNTRYPDSASFLVTENCNLACKYCFEKHNKKVMSKEVIHRGLELLCDGAKRQGRDSFHAMIFGGEPLLHPHLVEEILKYGLELQRRNNINFTASLITNATIMNDEIFRILLEYRDKVDLSTQLSVDGIKKVHDMYRVTKDGKGSFQLIEDNIEKFKQIYKNRSGMLTVHGVVNKKALPYLFESYRYFKEEWGFNEIWFMPLHEDDWTIEDIDIYRKELNKIADYIIEDAKKGKMKTFKGYSPINRCFEKQRPSAPCGAGKGFISITADGSIYPCHHFYFNHKELKIGNVWKGIDDSKRRIYLDYESSDMTCPNNCDHVNCYRCIAVNYDVNGSILSQVRGNYCKLSRVDREVQLRVKREIEKIEKKNPKENRKDQGTFIESWTEDGMYYERYRNSDGSESVYDRQLRNRDKEVNKNSDDKECDHNKGECQCGSKEEDMETLAMALKMIIEKLNTLEKNIPKK